MPFNTTTAGSWLAALIEINLDRLAVEAAAEGRSRIPFYRTVSLPNLQAGFRTSWQMQAAAFAGNHAPLRAHMQTVVTARVESGASVLDMLDAADLMRDLLTDCVRATTDLSPAPRHEAIRQIEALHSTLRMLISAINLQLVTAAPTARLAGRKK